jgi:hypothetical protein
VLASRIWWSGISLKARVVYPVRPTERATPLSRTTRAISASGVSPVRKPVITRVTARPMVAATSTARKPKRL